MSQFKAIGKSMYGTKYELAGSMPFADPDLTSLKWGDVIKDNGGNGMTLYVNECGSCYVKYLGGTLIMGADQCDDCFHSHKRSLPPLK